MTEHKHFKQLVRARMKKTGERYAAARRHVLAGEDVRPSTGATGAQFHLPGVVPGATAFRILLSAAGIHEPSSKRPFSEAMAFGLAGGIGIGVFSFLYEKANFASFFVGGRHLWHDHLAYLKQGCERVGASVVVKESSGAAPAARQLREMLADGKPCVAWVEMGLLPHRKLPAAMLGGGYYLVTVYEVDDARKSALIGDLADEPISIPLADLAVARARIKKDKHRLLSIGTTERTPPLAALVRAALEECVEGLDGKGAVKSAKSNFRLDALGTLAERMRAPTGKESWAHIYPPGPRLWNGLTMLHNFVEHNGTGGGLSRPLFADFLREASASTNDRALAGFAAQYDALGRMWSDLAEAALPADVPELAAARELFTQRSELTAAGNGSAAEFEKLRLEIAGISDRCARRFPMSDTAVAALRGELADRVRAIHGAEVAARDALRGWLD